MAGAKRKSATAAEMAARQREISVSEFFLKNRHLLGFDSPQRAVVTAVKEAVDNALDACEEAGILPEISVEVDALDDARFRVAVEDNGPGIVPAQIARIFGKLLYGSKFHELRQSRGQQGIGISAAGMYGQLTTGKPMRIVSRVSGEPKATELFVSVDTARNRPDIHRRRRVRWGRPHGTRVEVEMEGRPARGHRGIEMYLLQTAIANAHVRLRYVDAKGRELLWERSTDALPPRPDPIRPHPHGIELGMLIQMLRATGARTLRRFLVEELSRVGSKTAAQIIARTRGQLTARSNPTRIAHAQAEVLHRAISKTPVSAPRTDCLVPIGEARILEGLRKELDADFYTAVSRTPSVYRGNPFLVEVGLAYGRPGGVGLEVDAQGRIRKAPAPKAAAGIVARADEPVHLLRFANRVPLLHQQAGCAITRAVTQVSWKGYGLAQPRGALPLAPMAILVHLASVWVPFTSESKEAIASYPEIVRELELALREAGRALGRHLKREGRLVEEHERRRRIERYLPHVGLALQDILSLEDRERDATVARLDAILHDRRSV